MLSRLPKFSLLNGRYFSINQDSGLTYSPTETNHDIYSISMNRPSVRNGLSKATITHFGEIINSILTKETAPRALIIQSTLEKVFCAGADLKERKTMSQPQVVQFVNLLRSTFQNLFELPIPTIAVIEGAALGGGLELALACDFRFVSETAKCGLPETGLAIIPGAGGTQRLPRLIGPAKAKELIFSGKILSGQECVEIGLAERCFPTGTAYQSAIEFSETFLSKGPVAISAAKRAINDGLSVDLLRGLEIEQLCYDKTVPTKDRIEGLTAFAEKRKPVYIGE